MKELVPGKILDELLIEIKREFNVVIPSPAPVDPKAQKQGFRQWDEIEEVLRKKCLARGYRLGRHWHYAWIVLRDHFNWFGWVPSWETMMIMLTGEKLEK